jgi:hypothetical protein
VDAFDPMSSAAEADLRQGDILSRVDGVDVIGMPVPIVAEKIFGPVGTPVRPSSLSHTHAHVPAICCFPICPCTEIMNARALEFVHLSSLIKSSNDRLL